MFDIGASELLVVLVVAILVVAPKDLPGMLRSIGRYMGQARRMMGDVQRQMNDVMRQAELESVREDIDKATSEARSAMRIETDGKAGSSPAASSQGSGKATHGKPADTNTETEAPGEAPAAAPDSGEGDRASIETRLEKTKTSAGAQTSSDEGRA